MTTIEHDYGDPWDEGDIKALRKYLASGLTIQEIADLMGRSYGGVSSKMYRLRQVGLL